MPQGWPGPPSLFSILSLLCGCQRSEQMEQACRRAPCTAAGCALNSFELGDRGPATFQFSAHVKSRVQESVSPRGSCAVEHAVTHRSRRQGPVQYVLPHILYTHTKLANTRWGLAGQTSCQPGEGRPCSLFCPQCWWWSGLLQGWVGGVGE